MPAKAIPVIGAHFENLFGVGLPGTPGSTSVFADPSGPFGYLFPRNLEDGLRMALADAVSECARAFSDPCEGARVLKPRDLIVQLDRLRVPVPLLQDFVVLFEHFFDRFRMKQIQFYLDSYEGGHTKGVDPK
jgi:hypothetical protein